MLFADRLKFSLLLMINTMSLVSNSFIITIRKSHFFNCVTFKIRKRYKQ